MATSFAATATLAPVPQSYDDAELLASRMRAIDVYMESVGDYDTYAEFMESDDLAGYKSMSASNALRKLRAGGDHQDTIQRVEEAVEERPWIEEGLTIAPPPKPAVQEDYGPEFIQEVNRHVNTVKNYINFVTDYDSWEEVVEAYPDIRGEACDAVLSLRFLMDLDIDDYTRDSILYGPNEMVGLYPWVADGMQWAWRQMQNAIVD